MRRHARVLVPKTTPHIDLAEAKVRLQLPWPASSRLEALSHGMSIGHGKSLTLINLGRPRPTELEWRNADILDRDIEEQIYTQWHWTQEQKVHQIMRRTIPTPQTRTRQADWKVRTAAKNARHIAGLVTPRNNCYN